MKRNLPITFVSANALFTDMDSSPRETSDKSILKVSIHFHNFFDGLKKNKVDVHVQPDT